MKKDNSFLMAMLAAVTLAVIVILIVVTKDYRTGNNDVPDYVRVSLIDSGARSGLPVGEVRYIVIHYSGIPGAAAEQVREKCNESDADSSPHFIIGLEGEVIQCVPLDEKASDSDKRNRNSISVEVCHADESGEFTEESYATLVKLTAWLCDTYGLTENSIIRHYDVTGMECPLYFVVHEDAWTAFRADVREQMK